MTARLWCPGAERIPGNHSGGSGAMTGGPPRVIWHRTAGGTYESNRDYLRKEGFEPHLLWDPTTGQLGQFMPANVGAFAVQHTSEQQTNRMGRYCIQIEVADHGEHWNITSTPMHNLDKIIGWLRSLGIPDELPAGPMAPLGHSGNRDPHTWGTKGGHYGHCHVPQNDHTDPGKMDFKKIFGAKPASKKAKKKPLTHKQSAAVGTLRHSSLPKHPTRHARSRVGRLRDRLARWLKDTK